MAQGKESRKYDIVVIGATGYTGALTSEYIALNLPSNLKWAIAGRSKPKLHGLAAKLSSKRPERSQPGRETLRFCDLGSRSITTRQKLLASPVNVSGGTLESAIHSSSRDPDVLKEISRPWVLSSVEGRETSTATNVFGLRHDRDIGLLSASSATAATNRLVVHRTWGLLRNTDKDYGPNFQYNEYDRATSTLSGISRALSTRTLFWLLSFAHVRNIASRFLPNPGEGPDVERTRNSRIAVEGVAVPDVRQGERAPRALATFSYPSGTYHATALFLAQGAASLLYARKLEGGYSGGCLTPAILGDDFVQRIRSAGAVLRTELLPASTA
ncbi:hypothetical protein DL771_012139 [Monosporascus sp. 5C6A]|nr:hypothetical protein DL771_012139 [Monosporascus sp. 5C6A]